MKRRILALTLFVIFAFASLSVQTHPVQQQLTKNEMADLQGGDDCFWCLFYYWWAPGYCWDACFGGGDDGGGGQDCTNPCPSGSGLETQSSCNQNGGHGVAPVDGCQIDQGGYGQEGQTCCAYD